MKYKINKEDDLRERFDGQFGEHFQIRLRDQLLDGLPYMAHDQLYLRLESRLTSRLFNRLRRLLLIRLEGNEI